jgi:hypothetical protein
MTLNFMFPQRVTTIKTGLLRLIIGTALVLLALVWQAKAESCSTSTEMDAATKSALQSTAVHWFNNVALGSSQPLLAVSIPDIASNASGMDSILQEHKANLTGASASVRNVYLLDATGSGQLEKAEFYCGVFNSSNKIGFTLQNLPPGKYALVILDVQNSKIPYFYSFLMRQEGASWKVAGLFPRPKQIAGHDSQWYWQRAREFAAKGQRHNAWYYYLAARELAAPLPFMSTAKLDNFYDEIQQATPTDLPEQSPLPITTASGKVYQVTNLFVVPDDQTKGGLDLVVKYKTNDISDTGKTFIENKEVMKALLAKYPEFREPFGSLVARAVAPSGQDFGTMLPIKDVQ